MVPVVRQVGGGANGKGGPGFIPAEIDNRILEQREKNRQYQADCRERKKRRANMTQEEIAAEVALKKDEQRARKRLKDAARQRKYQAKKKAEKALEAAKALESLADAALPTAAAASSSATSLNERGSDRDTVTEEGADEASVLPDRAIMPVMEGGGNGEEEAGGAKERGSDRDTEEGADEASVRAELEAAAVHSHTICDGLSTESSDTVDVALHRVLEENKLSLIEVPRDGTCMFVSILLAFICRLAVDHDDFEVPKGRNWLYDRIVQSDGPLAGGDPVFIQRYDFAGKEGRTPSSSHPPCMMLTAESMIDIVLFVLHPSLHSMIVAAPIFSHAACCVFAVPRPGDIKKGMIMVMMLRPGLLLSVHAC